MEPETESRELVPTDKAAVPNTSFAASTFARLVSLFGYGEWSDEAGPVNLEDIIKISAVLAAFDVLSQDISKVKLELRRRLPGNGSEVVQSKEHWLARMLDADPNEHHTWNEFVEMLVLHLVAVQNAFIVKKFNARGDVTDLIPVLPGRVAILVDEESGHYVFDIERITPHERLMLRGLERFLMESEVIHLRGRMFDGLFGYSNLDAGSGVFSLALALQKYQTRLYRSDATMRGVFQMPNEKPLSEAAFLRLKSQLAELWKKARSDGTPIVLEEGMEFKGVVMASDAAEAAKAKASAVEDIARVFRIPPHKLMHIVNVKYENMETLEKSYVQDTLIPIANRIERRMERSLLLPEERGDLFLEFDREAMQLYDVEKQGELLQKMADRGALTIDEFRFRAKGLNALPNGAGKVRLIPANVQLVDENNEIVLPAGQSGQPGAGSDAGGDNAKKTAELRVVK